MIADNVLLLYVRNKRLLIKDEVKNGNISLVRN